MGIRETLNKSPRLSTWLAVVFVIVAGVVIFAQARGNLPGRLEQAFYSDDDGKTYFADDISRVCPFDRGGKPASRAYVCRGADGKLFVAYLERYNDLAKARIAQLSGKPDDSAELSELKASGLEVKRPGERQWQPVNSPRWAEIVSMKLPDGTQAKPVYP